jgi:2-iminobutanoate/2-iminopropanoate deaminase
MKHRFNTPDAPKAIGPYSQAIGANGFLFCSGQIGMDPLTADLVGEDVSSQCHQVMKNIKAILNEAGCDFTYVVKTTIFLADMNDFAVVNEIYGSYFEEPYPARETVAVKALPKNARVEITVTAVLP